MCTSACVCDNMWIVVCTTITARSVSTTAVPLPSCRSTTHSLPTTTWLLSSASSGMTTVVLLGSVLHWNHVQDLFSVISCSLYTFIWVIKCVWRVCAGHSGDREMCSSNCFEIYWVWKCWISVGYTAGVMSDLDTISLQQSRADFLSCFVGWETSTNPLWLDK